MATNLAGEDGSAPLRLYFDRSVKLAFRGSAISSNGGLLLHRELDDAPELTGLAASLLVGEAFETLAESFEQFCLITGIESLTQMMGEDVIRLTGDRSEHCPEKAALCQAELRPEVRRPW